MKVLIVKLSALGDIIHTYPAIELLKRQLPHAQIDWIVEANNQLLVERYPGVSRAIVIDTKEIRSNLNLRQLLPPKLVKKKGSLLDAIATVRSTTYDLVFDFQGNCKSAITTLIAKGSEKIGWDADGVAEWPAHWAYHRRFSKPPLPARERNIALVERFFQLPTSKNVLASLPKPLLTIKDDELALVNRLTDTWVSSTTSHPLLKPILVFSGSKWVNKNYPISRLLKALQFVNSKAPRRIIFMAGSEQEAQVLRQQSALFEYEVLFEPNVVVLQHFMKRASLVIGMDSMPIHLAQAASTPVFGLFGPTKMDVYLSNETGLDSEKKSYGYAGTCPYGVEFTRRCPRLRSCTTGACIREVDPAVIAEHLAKCWP